MSTIELEGGKYTVTYEAGKLQALRYGEPWRDMTGDKLIGCMVSEIERLRGLQPNDERSSEYELHTKGARHSFEPTDSAGYTIGPVSIPPCLSNSEIETLARNFGMRRNGNHWICEDADLHPMVRGLLYRYTEAPQPAEPCASSVSDKAACGSKNGDCDSQTAEPDKQHPDDVAVDAFAVIMKAKLQRARDEKGRGGAA